MVRQMFAKGILMVCGIAIAISGAGAASALGVDALGSLSAEAQGKADLSGTLAHAERTAAEARATAKAAVADAQTNAGSVEARAQVEANGKIAYAKDVAAEIGAKAKSGFESLASAFIGLFYETKGAVEAQAHALESTAVDATAGVHAKGVAIPQVEVPKADASILAKISGMLRLG